MFVLIMVMCYNVAQPALSFCSDTSMRLCLFRYVSVYYYVDDAFFYDFVLSRCYVLLLLSSILIEHKSLFLLFFR